MSSNSNNVPPARQRTTPSSSSSPYQPQQVFPKKTILSYFDAAAHQPNKRVDRSPSDVGVFKRHLSEGGQTAGGGSRVPLPTRRDTHVTSVDADDNTLPDSFPSVPSTSSLPSSAGTAISGSLRPSHAPPQLSRARSRDIPAHGMPQLMTLHAGCGGRAPTVILPWDPELLVPGPVMGGRRVSLWQRTVSILQEKSTYCRTTQDLAGMLCELQPDEVLARGLRVGALCHVIDQLDRPAHEHFFQSVLPWMIETVLRAPQRFKNHLPILAQGQHQSVTMTQVQAASLLCCAFFSLFPHRYHRTGLRVARGAHSEFLSAAKDGYGVNLGYFNFHALFCADGADSKKGDFRPDVYGKIRCLLEYFVHMHRHWAEVHKDDFMIEFVRAEISDTALQSIFTTAKNYLLQPTLRVEAEHLIEKCDGCVQADFANKILGGGVLNRGCVQEEIRMVISPELLIARLICEPLGPNEVVFMSGCAQYSDYSGYASGFRFEKPSAVPPPTPAERQRKMRDIIVVAFDATHYHIQDAHMQFSKMEIDKELKKAVVAFTPSPLTSLEAAPGNLRQVATGGWGCGAFNGDPELKFLIQLCAAAFCQRELLYTTFGNKPFADRCLKVHAFLKEHNVTADKLRDVLVSFFDARQSYGVTSIFDYILSE